MASLDVESLFTNIPLDETIENKMIYFWQLIKFIILKGKNLNNYLLLQHLNHFSLMTEITLKLMLLWYLLGPTLTDAFLCNFEKKWFSKCHVEILPNVYKRNVDDIFVNYDSYMHYLNLLIIWIANILTSKSLLKLKKH